MGRTRIRATEKSITEQLCPVNRILHLSVHSGIYQRNNISVVDKKKQCDQQYTELTN
jgi:hypothetical protein